MEFILINESKLKIMLSKADLEEFDIKTDKLDYSNTETKRMFWDIIDRAKKSVGFICDGSRVLVQLYSSRDGGCELFVSKLCATDNSQCYDELLSLSYHSHEVKSKDSAKIHMMTYGFDSIEWLISVCRRLFDLGYSGESSVYMGDDDRFYLFIDSPQTPYFPYLDEYSFICEYGTAENTEATLRFICEHGKEICLSEAVKTLSAF